MRVVIQRVNKANLYISNSLYSSINIGLLVLIGFESNDNQIDIEKITKKIIKMRIFSDSENKMNLSIQDIQGELLIVSQFTLYADCKKGNRPSFTKSAKVIEAQKIYNEFVNYISNHYKHIKTGEFRADMDIELINNGPVTIQLDSKLL
tara:strand:+ start:992 stop:1438 length:447 start_codon:yes stop_codon:yes gene_type:complete